MLPSRSVEPYTFKRARTDVLRTEMPVGQLLKVNSKAASGANGVPPLLYVDAVPFPDWDLPCRCCTTPFPNCGVTDKLKVELTTASEPRGHSFLSVLMRRSGSSQETCFSGSRLAVSSNLHCLSGEV